MSYYADCAATTTVSDDVMHEMLPWFRMSYGNPSSMHRYGHSARSAIHKARIQVSAAIGASTERVFFTSGGTEANNWAVRGLAENMGSMGKMHIVTTAIEHHSVLHPISELRRAGFTCTHVPVDSNGLVNLADVEAAITGDTAFISVMYANNEIGTIQPIEEIGAICRRRSVYFHVDAVQAVGKIPVNVKSQSIDLLSLSGHKLHGPKGIGALYITERLPSFPRLLHGGGQECGYRAGTENVPAIVGLGAAVHYACASMDQTSAKVSTMRDEMIESILQIPGSRLNGHRSQRLPGNANFSFEGVNSDSLILCLDLEERVAASSGSACNSASVEQSHVLKAIGAPENHASLRLTIDDMTSMADVRYICEAVYRVVVRLRNR